MVDRHLCQKLGWHEQVREQSNATSRCMYLKYLRMSSNVMLPVSWGKLWHHWRYLKINSEQFRCSILLQYDKVGNCRWCVLHWFTLWNFHSYFLLLLRNYKWLWKAWMKWELTFWTCSSSSSVGTSMSTRQIFCWRGRKRTQFIVHGNLRASSWDIPWYSILNCCDMFGAFFYDTDPSTATELTIRHFMRLMGACVMLMVAVVGTPPAMANSPCILSVNSRRMPKTGSVVKCSSWFLVENLKYSKQTPRLFWQRLLVGCVLWNFFDVHPWRQHCQRWGGNLKLESEILVATSSLASAFFWDAQGMIHDNSGLQRCVAKV